MAEKLPAVSRTPKMKDIVLTELKLILINLGQCFTSLREDFKKLKGSSPQNVISSITFKLDKLTKCAQSIQKICKNLKKESISFLPCLTSPVDEKPSKNPDLSA